MNLLLAEMANGNAFSWVTLGLLLLVLIATPIIMFFRNKKTNEYQQKLLTGLKVGDTVINFAGIVGTIVSIEERGNMKVVTLETGDEEHKGYIAVDAESLGENLSNPVLPVNNVAEVENAEEAEEAAPAEEVKEEVAEEPEAKKEEPAVEEKTEKEEAPVTKEEKPAKKPRKKKNS